LLIDVFTSFVDHRSYFIDVMNQRKTFSDIYKVEIKQQSKPGLKLIRFYLLVTLGFLSLRLLNHVTNFADTYEVRIVNDIWRVIYIVILVYLLYEYVIPFVRKKRSHILQNILIGLAFLIVYSMLFSWGVYLWRALGVQAGIYTSFYTKSDFPGHIASEQMAFSIMNLFILGIARHIYNYIKLQQVTQQLRIEKQQAELSFLKSQTNPHFLFNTLNNIYSLSRDKNDLAPESILRLSKILRFMLYETGGDFIPVEQELKIITDYIELEKLRYDDSLRINFNYDIEDMKQALPPLLLMPLVENAFKHGVSETRGYPFIDIHLSIRQRQLNFMVKNSSEGLDETGKVKENIGLSNLRRQLELLYKDYDLSVQQGTGIFTAVLKINLSSHV
jgi:two-component system, LytTR family, sensor kinase